MQPDMQNIKASIMHEASLQIDIEQSVYNLEKTHTPHKTRLLHLDFNFQKKTVS